MPLLSRLFKFRKKALSPPDEGGSWVRIFDSFPGAWQADISLDQPSILRFSAVFRSIAIISKDIAKLGLHTQALIDDVWVNNSTAKGRVLRRPNSFQTSFQFLMWWVISLLIDGNTYCFISRDITTGNVRKLIVLNPNIVTPLISDSGDVFYRIDGTYKLAGLMQVNLVVPASEMIHQTYLTLNHPLIGNSPLQVAGNAASTGTNLTKFLKRFNPNRPAGVLEAPEGISTAQANAIRATWKEFMKPENEDAIPVLEKGLEFKAITMEAVKAQILEAVDWSTKDVATAFGVPLWKLNAAALPAGSAAEAWENLYYKDTVQPIIEDMELLLGEALGFNTNRTRVQFDAMKILRMNNSARIRFWKDGISAGAFKPNEARADFGLLPVDGGDTPYLQQQNFSLAALAKRDAQDDPFTTGTAGGAEGNEEEPGDGNNDNGGPLPDDLQQQVNDGDLSEEEAREQAEARALLAYAGVYNRDKAYLEGDFVTYKGSLWYCKDSILGGIDAVPGTNTGAKHWTLAVKQGKSGNL